MSGWSAKVFLIVLAFGSLFPNLSIREERVRYLPKPLKISAARPTPPRIAFLQTLALGGVQEKKEESRTHLTTYNLNAVLEEGSLRPALPSILYRRVDLRPMIIHRTEALAAAGDIFSGLNYRPGVVYDPKTEKTPTWWEDLTPQERRRVEEAHLSARDLDFSDIEDPLKKAIRQKIQEELRREKSQSLKGWVISGREEKNDSVGGTLAQASAPTAGPAPAPDLAPSSPSTPTTEPPREPAHEKAFQPRKGPFLVSGHVEADASTAALQGYYFEVQWLREGSVKNRGHISPQEDSRYAIEVEELLGSIRVAMYDQSGTLRAYGDYRLSPDLTEQELRNALIQLRPAHRVASYSFDPFTGRKGGPRLRNGSPKTRAAFDDETVFSVDSSGVVSVEGVALESTSFAYTEAPGFYPAIHVMNSVAHPIPLVSTKTVRALQEILADEGPVSPFNRNGAVIWGRVVSNGQPVAGAHVELAQAPEVQPVYFNALLIPDLKLATTSENGYFVFTDLPSGYYSLKAFKDSQFLGFANVLNEAKALSYATIESVGRAFPLETRSFDAFTGEEKDVQLIHQALGDRVLLVSGFDVLDVPQVPTTAFVAVEARDRDYLSAIYPYPGERDYLHLPLIRRSWLINIQQRMNISPQGERATLVGFVHQGSYELRLPHLPADSDATVVFFDARGEVVQAPTADGGFVIFNVPVSAQTVVIQHADGGVETRIMPADPGQTTIVRFRR